MAPKPKRQSSSVDGAGLPPSRWRRAARAAAIEAQFLAGDLTLADALQRCFLQGLPVPFDVRLAFHLALARYEQGEVEDLAVPFGIAKTYARRKLSPYRWRKEDKVKFYVDWARKDGFPLSPPDGDTYTAFHAAAHELGISPATAHRYYYGKKKQR
jgi:hypothetical protein